MAGLLDDGTMAPQPRGLLGDTIDDPRTLALFAGLRGLLGGRGTLQGIANGVGAYGDAMQQSKQAAAQEQMRRLQMQQQQMALAQAQRAAKQQEAQDAFRNSLESPQMLGVQQAMQANGGPTNAAAAAIPQVDPSQQLLFGAMKAGLVDPVQYLQSQRKDNTPLITKAGDVARDPRTGKELWRNEDKATTPADWQLYQLSGAASRGVPFEQWVDARKRAGASTTSVSYGSPVAGVDAKGNPVFFQPSKDGGAPAIVPGVAPEKKDKPLTESQAKAAAFASQMQAAEQAFGTSGINGAKLGDQVGVKVAQGAGNFVTSDAAQKARQAQEQWAESYLRFKTGAAATEGEVIRNVRTFFPQPGEGEAVVRQKAQARQQAMHDVRIAAGGAPIETVNKPAQKTVVRTGTLNGRKVVQYADGTTDYAD